MNLQLIDEPVWFVAAWPEHVGLFGSSQAAHTDIWKSVEWDADHVPKVKRRIRENGGRVLAVIRLKKRHQISAFQRQLDAMADEYQASAYVRAERERNANRHKPVPPSKDGFINDYD